MKGWGANVHLWKIATVVCACLALCMGYFLWAANKNTDRSEIKPTDPEQSSPYDGERPIAGIGDQFITYDHFVQYAVQFYGDHILQQMLDDQVVMLESERLGIELTEYELTRELIRMQQGYDSEEQFYEVMEVQLGLTREQLQHDVKHRLLLEKMATKHIVITDEELEQYIDTYPEELPSPEYYHLQQIVVSTKQEALHVIKQLRQGVTFDELAAQYADLYYPGGDLGWVGMNDPFVPYEIVAAAGMMEVGQYSEPIALLDATYVVLLLKGKRSTSAEERREQMEQLRRQLALYQAPMLHEVVQDLHDKWGVVILDTKFKTNIDKGMPH